MDSRGDHGITNAELLFMVSGILVSDQSYLRPMRSLIPESLKISLWAATLLSGML